MGQVGRPVRRQVLSSRQECSGHAVLREDEEQCNHYEKSQEDIHTGGPGGIQAKEMEA